MLGRHDAAAGWLRIWTDLGRAPRTIDAYARGLAEYLQVCEREGVDPVTANRAHVAVFARELTSRPSRHGASVVSIDSGSGLSNATIQQRLVPVRLFYDHLIEEGLHESNPIGRGRFTPGRRFGGQQRGLIPRLVKLPWIPDEQQWRQVLAVAADEPIRNPGHARAGLRRGAASRGTVLAGLRRPRSRTAHAADQGGAHQEPAGAGSAALGADRGAAVELAGPPDGDHPGTWTAVLEAGGQVGQRTHESFTAAGQPGWIGGLDIRVGSKVYRRGMTTTYRISQLADRSGMPATTLRFYETAGLLPAGRTASGYRVYGEEAVERLAFISSAKLLGLALEEIRELLEVRSQGVCAPVRTRMLPLVADRIADTEGRIAELSAFSARLAGVHADLSGPAPAGGCGPDCGCTTTATAASPGPVAVTLWRTRPGPDPEPDSGAWRQEPVACTLDGAELGERTARWQQLAGRAERREDIPDGVRLTFPAAPELAAEVAALAAAEQGCCAFFDFTLHLTPAALQLSVRAPETAATMLADLFGATA